MQEAGNYCRNFEVHGGKESYSKSLYPEVFELYQLAACRPAMTVEVEQSFSSMSYIKNYLRYSMDDPRLSNLLLLYKSRDIVIKLDVKELMVKWHQEKSCRLPI
mmetsp:Transcript_23705/g.43031  ORF Transcript_23705/g.43031 Transcript_23705/m.43031 type:complete len:104 (-) Transcript_23705:41-352(-)